MWCRLRFATVIAVVVLVPIVGRAQRKPDFTGRWVLVDSTATGSTRTAGGARAGVRSSSHTISGAAFNCGRGCTLTLKGQTLTVANAELADYPGKDKTQPTPSLTLQVDGRQAEVVDTFSPGSTIFVVTKWEGNRLRIDGNRSSSSIRRTQLLAIEDGHLVVENIVRIDGEDRPELTLRYRRK
jgi:hypothetical protein